MPSNSQLQDKTPLLNNSHLVYCITCKDCNKKNIGLTSKLFGIKLSVITDSHGVDFDSAQMLPTKIVHIITITIHLIKKWDGWS